MRYNAPYVMLKTTLSDIVTKIVQEVGYHHSLDSSIVLDQIYEGSKMSAL